MKVHRDLGKIPSIKNPAVTIGTFDGVHMGHQKIIHHLNGIAKEIDGESVIVTFDPHPRLVIYPSDNSLRLLNTMDEKIELLAHFGIGHLLIVPFTTEFANLAAEEYIRDFLVGKIHPKKVVIGYDHRFGKNREGNMQLHEVMANRYGYSLEEIPPQLIDDIAVSSTKIRKALQEGKIGKATELLGYPYSVEGEVVKGKKMGVELGFPTANIQVRDFLKLIPENGVYAVKVHYTKDIFKGMLNIGFNPTFNGEHQTIEVNIFDFNKTIYGEKLKIEFVSFLRSEEKYNGVEELKAQLNRDRENAIKLLSL